MNAKKKIRNLFTLASDPLEDGSIVRASKGDLLKKTSGIYYDFRKDDITTPFSFFDSPKSSNLALPNRQIVPNRFRCRGLGICLKGPKTDIDGAVSVNLGSARMRLNLSDVPKCHFAGEDLSSRPHRIGSMGGFIPEASWGEYKKIKGVLIDWNDFIYVDLITAPRPRTLRGVAFCLFGDMFLPCDNDDVEGWE